MIPEIACHYRLAIELVEAELPNLISRHHKEHKKMTDQELLDELAKPSRQAIALLCEAAGTIEASLAEEGISDDRKLYRKELLQRVKEFLKNQA